MKSASVLALIAALMITAAAQRADNNTDEQLRARNAPDLFVYSASAFGPDKKGDSHLTIDVKNMGAKTITAFEWEYSSPDVFSASTDAGRVKFRSDGAKLRPEERKKFTRQVHHYTDRFIKSYNLSTVRILRVDYEDGSSWQRPAEEK